MQQRSFWKFLLLSIVTCGIYEIYFMYKYTEDINTMCAGDGEETTNYIAVFFLSLITCGIYYWVWIYKLGNRMQNNAPRYGFYISESGTTLLLWSAIGTLLCGIGPLIAIYYMVTNINQFSGAYNALAYGTANPAGGQGYNPQNYSAPTQPQQPGAEQPQAFTQPYQQHQQPFTPPYGQQQTPPQAPPAPFQPYQETPPGSIYGDAAQQPADPNPFAQPAPTEEPPAPQDTQAPPADSSSENGGSENGGGEG